jgi:hypothetical protein
VGGETPEQTSTYGKMNDWEKVKISLPLDRIISDETADYMGFATLIGQSALLFLWFPSSGSDCSSLAFLP